MKTFCVHPPSFVHLLSISGSLSSAYDAERDQLPHNSDDPTSSGDFSPLSGNIPSSGPAPTGEPTLAGDPALYGDPTPSGDPTSSGDPTPSGDPTSIQLQPNPSYCSVEMSHQQPMSSRLENESKYVNL